MYEFCTKNFLNSNTYTKYIGIDVCENSTQFYIVIYFLDVYSFRSMATIKIACIQDRY